jgi:putative acyl-CoA dehydrogenase
MQYETHEVFNQSHDFENQNLFSQDKILLNCFKVFGGETGNESLEKLGNTYGSSEMMEAGHLANKHIPEFVAFDNYGHRIDRVNFHPSYHQLMKSGIESGVACEGWDSLDPKDFLNRAGKMYLHNQIEQGTSCPITMTYAVSPALMHNQEIYKKWAPLVHSRIYDPRDVAWFEKKGITFGMAMTEKQGGSDVRANSSFAKKLDDGSYEIIGHKWFCSAPMSDAFLMLAKTDKGLSCFLVPRYWEDGSKNKIAIQRLKNKLGNKSNASSEIEMKASRGYLLGEESKGVNTIIEMVGVTRIDCMIGSASIMRQALSQALHHCSNRQAFGALLIEQDLMKNVLADLSLEVEAATLMAFRSVKALGNSIDKNEAALNRILTGLGKYWICKRATFFTHEAQECLGGLGYIEDHIAPRLFREAPVNSIWEGSGNIQCLDVMRALNKSPESLSALKKDLESSLGQNSSYDSFYHNTFTKYDLSELSAGVARAFCEDLAKLFQASLMIKYSPDFVSKAFCQSRLDSNYLCFGALHSNTEFEAIIQRAKL